MKYIIAAVAALVASLGLMALFGKYFRRGQTKSSLSAEKKSKASKEMKDAARGTAVALGTLKGLNWYEKMTEDESRAVELLEPLNVQQFSAVCDLYTNVYTDGHSLPADIDRYIDGRLRDKLKVLVP